ncbi:unknown [Prevotella sp. CAG:1031]|nr:unknown [Prevotella sp. CAG:1031]
MEMGVEAGLGRAVVERRHGEHGAEGAVGIEGCEAPGYIGGIVAAEPVDEFYPAVDFPGNEVGETGGFVGAEGGCFGCRPEGDDEVDGDSCQVVDDLRQGVVIDVAAFS